MRTAVKNLALLFLLNGSVSAVAFCTTAAIANRCGIDTFGRYSFYLAVSAYTAAAIRFGRERTMLRDLVQNPDDICCTLAVNLRLNLVVASLLGCCFLAAHFLYPERFPFEMLLVVAAISLLSFDLQPLYDSKRLMGRHAIYNFVNRGVYFAVVWGTIFFAPDLLNISCIGYGLLLGIVLALYMQFREAARSFKIDFCTPVPPGSLKKAIASGFPVAAVSILDLVYGPLLIILLKYRCGDSVAGIYSVAALLLYATTLLWQQIARVGNPSMAEIAVPGTPGSIRRSTIIKYAAVFWVFLLPFSALFVFFPQELIGLFFIGEYLRAAEIMPLFGTILLVIPVQAIASQYVLAARRDWLYFSGVAITTIFGAGLCWVLIGRYEMHGAAIGYAVTIILGASFNAATMVLAMCRDNVRKAA